MKKLLPILLVVTLLSSCATIVRKNTMQSVTFTTYPPNAEVYVDGNKVGNSPVTMDLETKESHDIQYKLKGYPTTAYKIEGKILPKYVVGDIVIGAGVAAPVGLIVDHVTNKWRGFDQYEIDGHGKLGDKLPVKDKDGDGIEDDKDDCPTVKGLASFNGCPDSDGDGIKDSDDLCPSTRGIAKFKGCPDTDGDGIKDSEDDCPKVAGNLRGCPDSDGDKVADKDDKCPKIAGTIASKGCPEISKEEKAVLTKAMKGIFFKSGSSVIKSKSYSILNQVAEVMKNNPNAKLSIEGHTDNTGNHDKNVQLSKDRASAVKAYLVKKGISADRMTSNGFGPDKPMDTNDTSAGRANNRRVEFTVTY